jgi:hypothetical protein
MIYLQLLNSPPIPLNTQISALGSFDPRLGKDRVPFVVVLATVSLNAQLNAGASEM